MGNEELHALIAVQVRDVGLVDGDTACVVTDMILSRLEASGFVLAKREPTEGETWDALIAAAEAREANLLPPPPEVK